MAKYLRRAAITERYGIPTSTLYDWMAKGSFPRPIRLGARSVGWSAEELEAWEQARIKDRDDAMGQSN